MENIRYILKKTIYLILTIRVVEFIQTLPAPEEHSCAKPEALDVWIFEATRIPETNDKPTQSDTNCDKKFMIF